MPDSFDSQYERRPVNPMLKENGLGGEFPTYNLLGGEDAGLKGYPGLPLE